MSNVLIDRNKIDILANAISNKSGEAIPMTLDEMVEAVDGIETGGGTPTLETVTKTYTPSTTAVTDTITPSLGYDGIEEVDVTVSAVPMAVQSYLGISSGYTTENNQRKWRVLATQTYTSAGYVNSGTTHSNYVYRNAIATGTSVTPTESSQTIGGADTMLEGPVTVNAIPSNYVGSGITSRSSSDLTSSNLTVTAPSGYYASSATKTLTDANLTAGNIKKDVTIFGVTGSYEGDGGGSIGIYQDANGYIVLSPDGEGGGGATQHTIHLEFSDSTDTDVSVYYDNSLIGTMITAYEPATWTYSSKTVTLAQLDNVTWYNKQSIPLNTELIDYTACLDDYAINSSGQAVSTQWYVVSDYTEIESGMTFSFKGCRWYYLAYYDSTQTFISSSYIDNISTPDQSDSNVGVGTLSSGIPANAKYIRITATGANSSRLSLIRTA